MPLDEAIWHGGDLGEARRLFPEAPEPWIDLSTGINPVAFPLPVIPPDVFRRLPASSALAKLERIAAEAYGAGPDEIVVAPGTQALIEILPRLRPHSRVAVVGPTYAEHARSWHKAGHAVSPVAAPDEPMKGATGPLSDASRLLPTCASSSAELGNTRVPLGEEWGEGGRVPQRAQRSELHLASAGPHPGCCTSDPLPPGRGRASAPPGPSGNTDAGEGADVLVVVNPNNPDGRRWSRAELARAAAGLAPGGWLVVDEAFADLEEIESLAGERPDGVLVLRSFGKTYGLAGIRLGFLIAAPNLVARMRASLGPWAVSGPALVIGQAALADRAWREQAARDRLRDAERLDALVRPAVERIVGGTRLFRCYETSQTAALFERLGRHGIWVRRFQDAPERLRFGLPGSEAEWARLTAALA